MNRRLLSLHIAAAFVFLILVAVGYRTGVSVATQRLTLKKTAPTLEPTATPAPTDTPILFTRGEKWNTYADKKEGFSISFPAFGFLNSTSGQMIGECGLNIKANGHNASLLVSIDALLNVYKYPISGTLASYINKYDPRHLKTYPPASGTGCDEAYWVDPYTRTGGTPFAYIFLMCRKGTTLYEVASGGNASVPDGCVPPSAETARDKGSDFPVLKQYADWEKHINFTLLP